MQGVTVKSAKTENSKAADTPANVVFHNLTVWAVLLLYVTDITIRAKATGYRV